MTNIQTLKESTSPLCFLEFCYWYHHRLHSVLLAKQQPGLCKGVGVSFCCSLFLTLLLFLFPSYSFPLLCCGSSMGYSLLMEFLLWHKSSRYCCPFGWLLWRQLEQTGTGTGQPFTLSHRGHLCSTAFLLPPPTKILPKISNAIYKLPS